MKLIDKELKQLLKDRTPKQIIGMYINSKIDLYSRQVDKLIKLKEKEKLKV